MRSDDRPDNVVGAKGQLSLVQPVLGLGRQLLLTVLVMLWPIAVGRGL